MQPILLNWAANNFYGWGIVGLNLLLHWANDSEIRPLMGFPVAESDLALPYPMKAGPPPMRSGDGTYPTATPTPKH